jgi:hypothetical protein
MDSMEGSSFASVDIGDRIFVDGGIRETARVCLPVGRSLIHSQLA